MNTADDIRKSLISKLNEIHDADFLSALNHIAERAVQEDTPKLDKAQLAMLKISETDLVKGRVSDQATLFEEYRKWRFEK